MDKIQIKRFISEIRKKRSIWDISSEEYKDKYIKKCQWEEVCDVFYHNFEGLPTNDKLVIGRKLQVKWKHLRDAYVRFLRNKNTNLEKGRKLIKMYVYARQLEFLKTAIHVRTDTSQEVAETDASQGVANNDNDIPESNTTLPWSYLEGSDNDTYEEETTSEFSLTEPSVEMADNDEYKEDIDVHNYVDDFGNSCIIDQDQNEKGNLEQTPEYFAGVKHVRRKINSTKDETVNYIDPQNQNYNNKESSCDDMDFFRSLLPFIKALPLHQKMKFRMDIMKLAVDYCEKSNVSETAQCFDVKEPKEPNDRERGQVKSPNSYYQSSTQSHTSFMADTFEPVFLNVKSEPC